MGPPPNARQEDESSAGDQLRESSSQRAEGDAEEQESADEEDGSESADGDSGSGQQTESHSQAADSDDREAQSQAQESETSTEGETDMQSVEIEEAQEVTIEEESDAGPDEGTTVLHVLLEGLHVNLLGLEIHLPELDLDVSAVPGEGRLLGNLLSQVAGLFDGVGGGDGLLSGLLGKLSPGNLLGKLSPRSILGGLKNRLLGVIPFVGGSDESSEEASGDEAESGESDGGEPSEGADEESGDQPSEGEETDAEAEGDEEAGTDSGEEESSGSGILGSIASKLRAGLGRLIPSLPVERALSWLVQTGLKRLVRAVDQRSGGQEASGEDEGTERATAADGGRPVESKRSSNHPGTETATTEEHDE